MSLIVEVIIDVIAGSESRVVNYVTIQAAWVKQIKLLCLSFNSAGDALNMLD